jgi:hypothetical protein
VFLLIVWLYTSISYVPPIFLASRGGLIPLKNPIRYYFHVVSV